MSKAWIFALLICCSLVACEKPCKPGYKMYGTKCVKWPLDDGGTDAASPRADDSADAGREAADSGEASLPVPHDAGGMGQPGAPDGGVACPPGTVAYSGDTGDEDSTRCDPLLCGRDQQVSAHTCLQCPAEGPGNVAGDDASQGDTLCDGALCSVNQRVLGNTCVACAPGTTNEAGDSPAGNNTSCEATLCLRNQRVMNHSCVGCPSGTTTAGGDNAQGADTSCEPTLCPANQHVANHACVDCPAGTTNAAGDSAEGDSTTCDPTLCGVDQHVASHACVPCTSGTVNDEGNDASGDDTQCFDGVLNYAFLSPVAVDGALGGLAGADELCDGWAQAGGIAGTYRAILSTATVDARTRLNGARGWIRPDGRPLADLPSELFAPGGPLTAIRIGPNAADLGPRSAWSASNVEGVFNSDAGSNDCSGWTAASSSKAWRGLSDTTAEWLDRGGNTACSEKLHIYCFQVDHYARMNVSVFAEKGRRMFVSTGNFDVSTGLAGADSLCRADAGATANLSGSFKALLAADGQTATSRFVADARAVVRPDGLRVAKDLGSLSSTNLLHTASVRADGSYWTFRVFTGASSPSTAGTSASTCDGWTATSGTSTIGMSQGTSLAEGERRWFGNVADSCAVRSGELPVYCMEE